MTDIWVFAALVGLLVAELAWRLVPLVHMNEHLRELELFVVQFKLADGDDETRERLLRNAGRRLLKIGLTALMILGAATALVCAVPWLQNWSTDQWLHYTVVLTLAATAYWSMRYWTRTAKP